MPTRVIRDGILTSEAVADLSMGAELFYRCLMSVVDDHGLYEANPRILRAKCFPLRENVTSAMVAEWLAECSQKLLLVYEVGGKQYLRINNFGQTYHKSKPKFPPPPQDSGNLPEVPGENENLLSETETETETFPETETSAKDCSGFQQEPEPEEAPASPPPIPNPKSAEPSPPGPKRASALPAPKPARDPQTDTSPPIRVETRQTGPNGMHRPTRIEIPPGLPPEHVELARTLRDVTDGRMSPDVPDADLVRFLLAEAEAVGMPPADLRALVVESVKRMRKSSSRWRPDSWGWFRIVLPSKIRPAVELPEMSRAG